MSSKITDLSDGGTVQTTDQFVVARSGANYKIAGSNIGGGSALTRSISQTGHGLAVGDVVKLTGADTYAKAKADTEANAEVVGIVSAVADANTFTLAMGGDITGLSGLTAGSVYYLSDATAGALTATEPSTIGSVSKPVLVARSTTAGVFFNMRGALISSTEADMDLFFYMIAR